MSDRCDELLIRLEEFLDGEAPEDVEATLERHLQACPPCLDRADFEKKVRELVASKCRDSAPASLVDAVKQRLQLH